MTNINNPHTSLVCVKQAEYFGHFSFRIKNRQWYETFKLKKKKTKNDKAYNLSESKKMKWYLKLNCVS